MAATRQRRDRDKRLFRACERKDYDEAKRLLKDGADPRKRFDKSILSNPYIGYIECTSLHIVCVHGSLELAKLLVESYQCDPEVETTGRYSGARPLHFASAAGHLDVVRYLVAERGCDAECVESDGETPLLWTCGCGRWFVPRDMMASDERALEVVKFLTTSANCDPNKRDRVDDRNALLWSCSYGLTSVARFLVSQLHCSAAVHDKYGYTPVHLASVSNSLQLLQFLISEAQCDPNVRNNDGDTPVHLASGSNSLQLLQFLISEAQCNTNVRNNDGQTPIQLVSDPDTIRELIKNGANMTHMYKHYGHLLGHSFKQQLPNPVKLLIVGDPSSGKSTLTESLQKESILNRIVKSKVSGVSEKTAGIIPHQFHSKKLGHISIFDFAGQREFYNSHGALLQNTTQSSAPIFLIVVDLCKSDKEISSNIDYWLSFIMNYCCSKPHIIIIGSHVDALKSKGQDPNIKIKRISSSLQQSSQSSSFTLAGFVAMDCRYPESSGMRELRQCLQKSCDEVRLVTQNDFLSHCLLVFIIDRLKTDTATKLSKVLSELTAMEYQDEMVKLVPQTIEEISELCDQLHSRGHILFLKNSSALEKSWIILNQTVLLSEVSGTIFAPEGFREHCKLASSTGVVPLSKITAKFPKHKPEMLIGFLSHLEYCSEISDEEITQLIDETKPTATSETEAAISTEREHYFFFPGLVTLDAPAKVWEPQPQFVHHCGWILQCPRPEHFFAPRFLQVLLLRLAFSFALTPEARETTSDHPAIERKCFVWTNGILWANEEGVHTLLEFKDNSKTVIVAMRCRQDNVTKCLHLRSQVIQKVLAALREFCPKVVTAESFIDPSELSQYPLKVTSVLTLYPLSAVAKAVVAGKSSVVSMSGKSPSLESLLLFEPYADLGEPILRKLFDYQDPSPKVSQSDLMDIGTQFLKRIENRRDLILELLPMDRYLLAERMTNAGVRSPEYEIVRVLLHWRDVCEGTYQCLRGKLDQFSAFAGRNPLVSCANRPWKRFYSVF